jgi:hypothetical protein
LDKRLFYAFILRRSLAEDLRRIFARLRFQFSTKEFMFLASCGIIGGLLSLTCDWWICLCLLVMTLMTKDLNLSGRLRAEVHGLRLRLWFLFHAFFVVGYLYIFFHDLV